MALGSGCVTSPSTSMPSLAIWPPAGCVDSVTQAKTRVPASEAPEAGVRTRLAAAPVLTLLGSLHVPFGGHHDAAGVLAGAAAVRKGHKVAATADERDPCVIAIERGV